MLVVHNMWNIFPNHVSCRAVLLCAAHGRNPAGFHSGICRFQLQLQQEGHERIETLLTQHPHHTHTHTTHAPIPPSSTRKQLSAGPSPSFPAQHNAGKEDVSFPAEDQPANLCATLGKEFSSQIPGVQRPPQSVSQSGRQLAGARKVPPCRRLCHCTLSQSAALDCCAEKQKVQRKPSVTTAPSAYCGFVIMPGGLNLWT